MRADYGMLWVCVIYNATIGYSLTKLFESWFESEESGNCGPAWDDECHWIDGIGEWGKGIIGS